MSDTHNQLQHDFEQLPDAEPPFGQDTRIKALAREQLQSQREQRAKSKRWGSGLATLACAALVFFIAKPLLQKPVTLESVDELSEAMATEQIISEDAASIAQPSIQREVLLQKSSAGGGSEAIELKRAEPAQLVQPNANNLAAPTLNDKASKLVGRATKSFSGAQLNAEADAAPTLEHLLSKLKQAEGKPDAKETQKIMEEIKRLYPDYKQGDR